MAYRALKHFRFGGKLIAPDDPVPVQPGRDYGQMQRFGQIGDNPDELDNPEVVEVPIEPNPDLDDAERLDAIEIPDEWTTASDEEIKEIALLILGADETDEDAVEVVQSEVERREEAEAERQAAIDIPENWAELHHQKMITLAKEFDPDVTTKAEAIVALEAELEFREEQNGEQTENPE